MLDPEGGQGVVVDAHPAAQPAIGVVLGAQPIEGPRAADALERGVQPEGGQDRGIDRWPAGVTLDRPDPLVQRREVEALDEAPHESGPVVGWQETLEIDRAQLELAPVGTLESRHPGRGRLGLRWIGGREREEGVVHARIVRCDTFAWESPGRKIHDL